MTAEQATVAFVAFANALLSHAKNVLVDGLHIELRFQDDGWLYAHSPAKVAAAAIRQAQAKLGARLFELPGARASVDAALRAGLLELPNPSASNDGSGDEEAPQRDTLIWMEMVGVVRVAAERYGGLEIPESVLHEVHRDWQQAKRAPSWVLAVPVPGLVTDASIELGAWRLEPFASGQKDLLLAWVLDSNERYIDRWECARASWVLTRSVDGPLPPTGIREAALDAWSLVTALRLHGAGVIGAPVLLHQPAASFGIRGGGQTALSDLRMQPDIRHVFPLDDPYHLDHVVCAEVLKTATIIATRYAELGLCLRRFNLAASRAGADDALVDLTIALEASLLGDGDTRELNYRLANRGAALLRRTRNPSDTNIELRSMYSLRSKIVHTGKSLSPGFAEAKLDSAANRIPFDQYLQLTRALLVAFVRLVQECGTKRDACQHLDNVVLRALACSEE